MSTGLDCDFTEREPNQWWLSLEQEYGHKLDPEYDEYGPFETFAAAEKYLRDNFANPGGYSVGPHANSTDTTAPTWERTHREAT